MSGDLNKVRYWVENTHLQKGDMQEIMRQLSS